MRKAERKWNKMEVILLQDVKGVGKKNQTVSVNDGYANNFLFPRKLAVKVSKTSVQILANQQENARIAEENARKNAIELAEQLKNMEVSFKMKVGKEGKTFGSISLKQVEEAFKNKYNVNIDKRKFIDKGPLDMLGYYNLKIELHKGVIGVVKVHLEEEK
ncbi:MAG: 50S ribosomal protein L9 [Erysipelotrichaceae bacterium]|nr:50S ribosomal protein L9 [Erysipelotrichaceae bacterium]